ncbi:MAG: MMPL family transporter [Thermoplasmata archaeon]|nr:MMPL family transporter [Thermoplasmata archaeon]
MKFLNNLRKKKASEAIVSSVKNIGMAMLLATITTCIGFLSFLTSSVPSIRNFGLLCAIGIIYTFIITITLLASIRYILDRKKKIEVKERKFIASHLMKKIADIVCKNPKKAIVLVAVFTILFAFGSINLKTEFNMKDFVPKESKSIRVMEKIGNDFPFSSQQQEYILIEGNIANIAVLEEMKKTIANTEDDEYVARSREGNARIESIISIMEKAIEGNASLITKYNIKNGMPQTNEDVKAFFDYLYESKEFEREVKNVLYKEGDEYKAALIRVYAQQDVAQEGEKMKKFYEELKEDLAFRNVKAIVTGQITLTYMITSSLTESQIKSTIACIILAGIVLIIAYRRIFYGIAAMLPVAIAAIWILGTIYFIGYSLNVMTVMITSLTIGLGITYAIHAVERYRIMKDELGYEKAVFDSIYHTGTALFMAALTTIAGFAILIFSPIPPEQQFGIVTAITILYSFIITILLVPSLFLLRKEKK